MSRLILTVKSIHTQYDSTFFKGKAIHYVWHLLGAMKLANNAEATQLHDAILRTGFEKNDNILEAINHKWGGRAMNDAEKTILRAVFVESIAQACRDTLKTRDYFSWMPDSLFKQKIEGRTLHVAFQPQANYGDYLSSILNAPTTYPTLDLLNTLGQASAAPKPATQPAAPAVASSQPPSVVTPTVQPAVPPRPQTPPPAVVTATPPAAPPATPPVTTAATHQNPYKIFHTHTDLKKLPDYIKADPNMQLWEADNLTDEQQKDLEAFLKSNEVTIPGGISITTRINVGGGSSITAKHEFKRLIGALPTP